MYKRFILDVDGVLNDGMLYWGVDGKPFKAFGNYDHDGLKLLRKHIDRDACEISVTVHIGSDGTSWPFYLDGNSFNTKPGDAIIYLGPKLMHYREIFKGDWYLGAFLHYVDAEGPHKDRYMDKRMYWGTKGTY